MIIRRAAAVAVAVGVLVGVTACTTAEPEPTPTPPFASEAEAFAAAEATYRAYVDALNGVDLSDPETFEPVYLHMTGSAEASTRENFSTMHAEDLTVLGRTEVALVEFDSASVDFETVELSVCLDVSDVDVLDANGQSVVTDDRGDVHAMTIELKIRDLSMKEFTVDSIEARSGAPLCE